MQKRKLHAFEVPAVGFGTTGFDVRASRDIEERRQLIELAKEASSTFIDTSATFGEAEKVLGRVLPSGDNTGFQLSTKLWTSGERAGQNSIMQSFAFLMTQYIDVLTIHNCLDFDTHIETIEKLQDDDKVGLAGVSALTHNQYQELMEIMETERVQVVQIPYNILEKRAEEEVFDVADKFGQGIVAIMPFNQGGLFRFKRRAKVDMEPLEAVGIQTWGQALLAWVLADPRISSVVPGTTNPDHLVENAAVGDIAKIDETLRKHIEKEAEKCLV